MMTFFSYDLGSGQAVIATRQHVVVGRSHRVLASRVGRNGSIRLDDGAESFGSSPGSLRSLNVEQSYYVGHVGNAPDRYTENCHSIEFYIDLVSRRARSSVLAVVCRMPSCRCLVDLLRRHGRFHGKCRLIFYMRLTASDSHGKVSLQKLCNRICKDSSVAGSSSLFTAEFWAVERPCCFSC